MPGLLLAILGADLEVSVSEAMGKKARALAAMVEQLRLAVPVYSARGEEVLELRTFDTLVARAVGPMWKLLKWLGPCRGGFGRLWLIKGPRWVDERAEARHRGVLRGLELRRLASYTTPGHAAPSVILGIWPKSAPAKWED